MNMIKKPLKIGISIHYICTKKQLYYFLYTSYAQVVIDLGHIPILIPIIEDDAILDCLLNDLDGVFISGGGPGLKTHQRVWPLKNQNPRRYDFEENLINMCLKKEIPLLGICRGFQTIAQVLGGKINHQIISPINHRHVEPHSAPVHPLNIIDEDSLIFRALKTKHIEVNSIHTQSVEKLPSSLKRTAISPEDDVLECYESVKDFKPFILGLQFHPEKMYTHTPIFADIFEEFFKILLNK